MDEIKLKPCPFCGCEEVNSHTGSFGYVFFRCPKCSASVTFDKDVYSYNPEEAEKAWNRRRRSEWMI
jgi:Lar family restriction alleviation protein